MNNDIAENKTTTLFFSQKIEIIQGSIKLHFKNQNKSKDGVDYVLYYFVNQSIIAIYRENLPLRFPDILVKLTDIEDLISDEKTGLFKMTLFNKDAFKFYFLNPIVGELFESKAKENIQMLKKYFNCLMGEENVYFKQFVSAFFENRTKKIFENNFYSKREQKTILKGYWYYELLMENLLNEFLPKSRADELNLLLKSETEKGNYRHLYLGQANVIQDSFSESVTDTLKSEESNRRALIFMVISKPIMNCNAQARKFPTLLTKLFLRKKLLNFFQRNQVYIFFENTQKSNNSEWADLDYAVLPFQYRN